MTDQLQKRLAALRAVAPRLNAVADEANRIVKQVESQLREMGVGISATSGAFSTERRIRRDDATDEENEEEVEQYLAFGRHMGVYGIHIREVVYRRDPYDNNRFTE